MGRDKIRPERLGWRDIPGVIYRQVGAQLAHAVAKRFERVLDGSHRPHLFTRSVSSRRLSSPWSTSMLVHEILLQTHARGRGAHLVDAVRSVRDVAKLDGS